MHGHKMVYMIRHSRYTKLVSRKEPRPPIVDPRFCGLTMEDELVVGQRFVCPELNVPRRAKLELCGLPEVGINKRLDVTKHATPVY
jgi:hypothetical protein